ncbi:MAG TPA: hypothetical protein VFC78_11375 [Tepidisphaeraceae bacterium]|nr:hypothetical protein [Tepidisphaeraceae bacterium]
MAQTSTLIRISPCRGSGSGSSRWAKGEVSIRDGLARTIACIVISVAADISFSGLTSTDQSK